MLAALILYQLAFPLIGIGIVLQFLASGRGRTLLENADQLRQRLGLLNADELARLGRDPDRPPAFGPVRVLWMHAASVGEVNAAAPFLRELSKMPQKHKVLFTTSTATGRDKARGLPGVDVAALAPVDFFPAVSAFLERARPFALCLVETELWPCTLLLARRRGVRLALLNGRISPRAFRRYRWIAWFLRPLLDGIDRAAVQTEDDAERLKELGVPAAGVRVTGNLKLDLPPASEEELGRAAEVAAQLGWAGSPIWIAASTRPGEEEAVVDAHLAARAGRADLKLVLAPRHVERAPEVEALLERRGMAFVTLSKLETRADASSTTAAPRPVRAECLLIDRMGLLRGFYPLGAAAFVGGTLADVGGHNLLEPAMASLPVLFGPHVESVKESAQALRSAGGGIMVRDAAELRRELERLISDARARADQGRKARQAAERLSGAAGETMRFLAPILSK